MRNAALLALACAAACTARGPTIDGAPERRLESALEEGGDGAGRPRPCLYVVNHTRATAAVYVDGRHVGWIAGRSAAGLYVGRSAGATSELRAESRKGTWRATARGPVWDLTWHLRGNSGR